MAVAVRLCRLDAPYLLCMVSYACLTVQAGWQRPQLAVRASTSVIYLLSLIMMGLIMHLLLRQLPTARSRAS